MQQINENVERLRRHYDPVVQTYDLISFKDLANSLRIWSELKPVLESKKHPFATAISFKTEKPPKKALNVLRGEDYVYATFPGAVITFAHDGHLYGAHIEENTSISVTAKARILTSGAQEVAFVSVVKKKLDESQRESMRASPIGTRCNFTQWMGAEALRVGTAGKVEALIISREMLIKRMANTLGGSHLHTGEETLDIENINRFDLAINTAMDYEFAGLPLPYFALLKIAQDILEFAKKKLEQEI